MWVPPFRKKTKKAHPLEAVWGYIFKEPKLLEEALTHPSFSHAVDKSALHYERLEFLGDAILGALLAEQLYTLLPKADEGVLAQAKGVLGKGRTLAAIATYYKLPTYLRLSPAETKQGSAYNHRVLASTWEACIGAAFVDGGYAPAQLLILEGYKAIFMQGLVAEEILNLLQSDNPKGRLQEYWQRTYPHESLEYALLEALGPGHRRHYKVVVRCAQDQRVLGTGEGFSKKEAEERAAENALP